MMKTRYDWLQEADSFLFNWINATGKDPTKEDVVAECMELIDPPDNPREYGETLWQYIKEIMV